MKIGCYTNGQVDQLKALLVEKWYTQVHGQDYSDIFSLVVKDGICLPLSSHGFHEIMATTLIGYQEFFLAWWLGRGDLHGETSWICCLGGCNRVCKLHKFLYGLKQSPRTWFERFSKVLQ